MTSQRSTQAVSRQRRHPGPILRLIIEWAFDPLGRRTRGPRPSLILGPIGRLMIGTITALVALSSPAFGQSASLYEPAVFRSLTADHKALRAGDTVTVQVLESASATADADTGTHRGGSVSASVSRSRSGAAGLSLGLGADVQGDFDGGGRTARTGKLLAQISITVREVLPNGELWMEGSQLLKINDELQRIHLEGRARPQDISDGNVILSSRLADARITYLGEGHLSERQRPSWWRRLLDQVGF